MTERPANGERREAFTLHCRWFTLRITGNVIFGLTFALAAVLVAGLFFHDQAVRKGMNELASFQQITTQAVNELVYVTKLTPEERKELKLEMPDSLRKKLRKMRQESDE